LADPVEETLMQEAGYEIESIEDAADFMARAERAFHARDTEAIIELFADDVVVVFADFPPMRGKREYLHFLRARLARQLDYRPSTTIRVASNDVIGSSWEASWTDANTGLPMQGRGCEFVTVKSGKVIEFIASFNAWEAGGAPRTPII
jgi:ketosteroid isomerase-like protein